MPWKIIEREGQFCVAKTTGPDQTGEPGQTDEIVKCHQTRDLAVRHLRALYANYGESDDPAHSHLTNSVYIAGIVDLDDLAHSDIADPDREHPLHITYYHAYYGNAIAACCTAFSMMPLLGLSRLYGHLSGTGVFVPLAVGDPYTVYAVPSITGLQDQIAAIRSIQVRMSLPHFEVMPHITLAQRSTQASARSALLDAFNRVNYQEVPIAVRRLEIHGSFDGNEHLHTYILPEAR